MEPRARLTALLLLLQGASLLHCQGDGTPAAEPSAGAASGGTSSSGSGGTPAAGNDGAASAGASGDSAAGGGSGGSGGAGGAGAGGAAPEVSKRQACQAYAVASCRKDTTCMGNLNAICLPPNNCPDVVFSPGSTRTVEGLLACLPEIEAYSCDLWRQGFRPDCVTLGERQPGDACLYPSQCASLTCGDGECGQCLAPVAEGQSCAGQSNACANGLECGAGDLCTPIVLQPVVPIDNTIAPLTAGATCIASGLCEMGLVCAEPSGGPTGQCREPAGLDELCRVGVNGSLHCQSGLYCNAEITCRPLPALGEACGQDGMTSTRYCEDGLFCDPPTISCQPRAPAGAPCEFIGQCAEGTCRSPSNAFAYCINGLFISPDDETNFTDCVCAVALVEGDACDPALHACEEGTACTSGRCTGVDSLGLFEAACGSGN